MKSPFVSKEGFVIPVAAAVLLVGIAIDNAVALLLLSSIALVVMATIYRRQPWGSLLVPILTGALMAGCIALILSWQ